MMGLDDPKFVIDFVRKCNKNRRFELEFPFQFDGESKQLTIHSNLGSGVKSTLKSWRVCNIHDIYIHVLGYFTLDATFVSEHSFTPWPDGGINYTKFDKWKLIIDDSSDRETIDHLLTVLSLTIGT